MPNLVAGKYTFSVSKSIQNNCLRTFSAELEPNVLDPLVFDVTLGVVNPVVSEWSPGLRNEGSQAAAGAREVSGLEQSGVVREFGPRPVLGWS
jgi:hypothetical protein